MLRRTKLITSAVTIAVVVGGSSIMATQNNTPEPVKSTVSEVQETVADPVVETTAPEPVVEAPVAPTPQPVAAPAPRPVNPCISDKANAVAPIQAQLDDYDAKIAERTAWLTEKYHTMKGLGKIDDWVTLEYYLNYDLNQTLRPVRDRVQVQHDTEAAKFAC